MDGLDGVKRHDEVLMKIKKQKAYIKAFREESKKYVEARLLLEEEEKGEK